MLPNFMIVGAPKAGTTSLCHYLSAYPQVFMSNPKEVNFFSKEEIEGQGLFYKDFKAKNLAEYEQLFAGVADEKAIGEGSVSYLFYPKTPQKIKNTLPNVKIIILLREPVSRGFSHYLMDYRLGLVNLPYDAIVYQKNDHKNKDLYFQQYVGLGLYYNQVKRYVDCFGHKQVKIYLQEDMRQDIRGVIGDLSAFLELEGSFATDVDKQHNVFSMPRGKLIRKLYASPFVRSTVSKLFSTATKEVIKSTFFERTNKPTLEKKLKDHLVDFYKNDVEQLERLIGRDLGSWYKRGRNV